MKNYFYFQMGLFFLKHAGKLKEKNYLSDAKQFYSRALWMMEKDEQSGKDRSDLKDKIKKEIAEIYEKLDTSFDRTKFFSINRVSNVAALKSPAEAAKTDQKITNAVLYVPQGQGALLQESSECSGLMTNRFVRCSILIGIDLVNKKIIMIHADGMTPIRFIKDSFAKLSPQALKIVCYKNITDETTKRAEMILGKDYLDTFEQYPLDLGVQQLTVRLDGLLSVDFDLFSSDLVKTHNMKCVDAASYLINCFIDFKELTFHRVLGDDAASVAYPCDMIDKTFANLQDKLGITKKSSIAHAINQLSIGVRDGKISQVFMYSDFGIGVLVLLGEFSGKSPVEELSASFEAILHRQSIVCKGTPSKGHVVNRHEIIKIINADLELKPELIEKFIKKYEKDPVIGDNIFFTLMKELKLCFDVFVIRQWYINWQAIAMIQNQEDKSDTVGTEHLRLK